MQLWPLSRGNAIKLPTIIRYVGLALAFLAFVALLVTFSLVRGRTLNGGWVGFFGFTVLLFWLFIRQGRKYWNRWGFWLFAVASVTIHSVAFVAILRKDPAFRMIWFVPIVIVEAALFGALREALFSARTRRSGDAPQ